MSHRRWCAIAAHDPAARARARTHARGGTPKSAPPRPAPDEPAARARARGRGPGRTLSAQRDRAVERERDSARHDQHGAGVVLDQVLGGGAEGHLALAGLRTGTDYE